MFLGYTEDNERLELTADDLETHVHGIGASRSGKSKLLEWLARECVRNRQGFCLIDPHGFLYQDLLRWLTWIQPNREIVLFNPSFDERIVGFNPFRAGRGDPGVQAERRVRATVKAWGVADTDATPRLERWLRCFYHTLLEQDLSLEVAQYLFTWKHREIRDRLVSAVRSNLVRNEWEELAGGTAREFTQQLESTRNRLFRFLDSLPLRRMMALPTNNIDVEQIIERGQILLVNLQPSETLTEQGAQLVGTLLLNEIWEIGMRRRQGPGGKAPDSFFVMIDEFQKFLTPDVPAMLDQAAKYGIHLFLFHQHLSQLRTRDEEIFGAVMTNARTKFVFGGLSRDDARLMAEAIFPGQLDFQRVKYLIEQTKFWPVYGRDTVYTRGSGGGSSSSTMTSQAWNPSLEEWVPTTAESSGDSTSWQEGESDIPVFSPEPFREVSSVQLFSLEELLWQLADRMMEQYQRHFMFRRAGKRTTAAVTPFVQTWNPSPSQVRSYVCAQVESFLSPADVDDALVKMHQKLDPRAAVRTERMVDDEEIPFE